MRPPEWVAPTFRDVVVVDEHGAVFFYRQPILPRGHVPFMEMKMPEGY